MSTNDINTVQPQTIWKNVTREQFIIICHVNINEKRVEYIDRADKRINPTVYKKSIPHLFRLFELTNLRP